MRRILLPTLQLVGLKDTGSKPAGKFSLGMRQRLGLAVALFGENRNFWYWTNRSMDWTRWGYRNCDIFWKN